MKAKSILSAAAMTAVAALTLTLAGCGGGGDDAPSAASAVPANVSQSSGTFTDYLKALTASVNVDDLEPVSLAGVTNPPEDNDSPPALLQ